MVAAASMLVGALIVATPPAANAASCVYDSATRNLTLTIAPSDSQVLVQASAPYLQTAGALCVLLGQVSTVTFDVSAAPFAAIIFNLANGPLGPGYLDEGNGSSEIEFVINGMSVQNHIDIQGTSGNDVIRLGQYTNRTTGVTTGQINLNGTLDGASPDVDVSFTAFPGTVRAYGNAGDDTLEATGTGVALTGNYGGSVHLDGGVGTNVVTGGNGSDMLWLHQETARSGIETVRGGAGRDQVVLSSASSALKSSITLDDVANDGVNCPGINCDGDNVAADIETVIGSAASETIVGNAATNYFDGNGGNDVLKGAGGSDYLVCGGGRASGGKGADIIEPVENQCVRASGGAGKDSITFNAYSYGVWVTLDNLANDGSSVSNLDVRSDIESFEGTSYDDWFYGNGKPNVFDGAYGDDELWGAGGNDTLIGNDGSDILYGQRGDDSLDGGSGYDTCSQGAGTGPLANCEA